MRQALIDMGYSDCYHMASATQENPRDAEMWIDAFRAKFEGKGKPFTREDWDQLLGHCMAVTCMPCTSFAEELIAAYPDAKVILSVPDNVDVWYSSVLDTLITNLIDKYTDNSLSARIWRFFTPETTRDDIIKLIVKYTGYQDFRETGRSWYIEHNEMIRCLVPKENLLEYNVKEGWQPLCKFLGEEVPNRPFPRVNDAATLNKISRNKVKFGGFLCC